MNARRRIVFAPRRPLPGRLVVLLPLLLAVLAACGPGGGKGAGY